MKLKFNMAMYNSVKRDITIRIHPNHNSILTSKSIILVSEHTGVEKVFSHIGYKYNNPSTKEPVYYNSELDVRLFIKLIP